MYRSIGHSQTVTLASALQTCHIPSTELPTAQNLLRKRGPTTGSVMSDRNERRGGAGVVVVASTVDMID